MRDIILKFYLNIAIHYRIIMLTCQIFMLSFLILILTCHLFICSKSIVWTCFVNVIQIATKLSVKSTLHLKSQHKDRTSRHHYLTTRHYHLTSWHNIWQLNIIIWKDDFLWQSACLLVRKFLSGNYVDLQDMRMTCNWLLAL